MNSLKQMRSLFLDAVLEKKRLLVGVVLALLLLSLSQGLSLLLIGSFFKAIFGAIEESSILLSQLLPSQLSRYFPQLADLRIERQQIIKFLPASIFAVAVMRGIAGYLYQYNQQAMVLFIGHRYRSRLFAAAMRQSYTKLLARTPGEWMSLIMNDVTYIQSRLSDLLTGLIKDSFSVLSILLTLYVIHWQTAVFASLLALPIMLWTGKTGRRIAHHTESWQRALARMTGAVLDIRKRSEFIRAQHGEAMENKRFQAMTRDYYEAIRRSIMIRSAFAPSLEFVGFVFFALILLFIGQGWLGRDFSADTLFQLLLALGLILRPLKGMGEQLSRYHETRGILRQSIEILKEVEEHAHEEEQQAVTTLPDNIVIEQVRAGYQEGFAIEARKLSFHAGQSIAIIGPSGGGKSTILKCLAGLYRPLHWSADLKWQDIKSNATLVSQNPFLFSGSIRENLSYGLGAGSISDERMKEALHFVGLDNELAAKGQDLDTELNFLQSPLSGGQMQRLTIARGLLRPQAMLLMDEVTSAIDPAAEESLTNKVLQRVKKEGRILLYVTHRLSQLSLFDQVWFCEGGKVQIFKDGKEWQKSDRVQRFLAEEA